MTEAQQDDPTPEQRAEMLSKGLFLLFGFATSENRSLCAYLANEIREAVKAERKRLEASR